MIADVLGYARTRLKTFDLDEWTDAFAFDNIPRTSFERIFHLELGTVTKSTENHDFIKLTVPFTVRILRRTFRQTGEGRDDAIAFADSIIDDFILASNRLTQSGLEVVFFDAMSLVPLDDTNDNSLILTLDFTALVTKCTR